jgi:hypothetical protein
MSKRAAPLLSDGQREYETKRAAKAGMSLEKWLETKQKQQAAAARERAAEVAKPAKPGLIKRLLDRAHQPLKSKDDPKSR